MANSKPLDSRICIYNIAKFFIFVIIISFFIKFFLFDTFLIDTDQMEPAIKKGDRVIVLKLFTIWPFSNMSFSLRNSPVIFKNPFDTKTKNSCLRISAISGDTVVVSNGQCIVKNKKGIVFKSKSNINKILPADYSPKDSIGIYVLPKKKEKISLDSLPLLNFFFTASLIKQENPNKNIKIKPILLINGEPYDTIFLNDFYLYKGRLDSIPESFNNNWFFWNRLNKYLTEKYKDKDVYLNFRLLINNKIILEYKLQNSCIFLIADNWQKGFDSRYFGPVLSSCVKGRIFCALWSIGNNETEKKHFRFNRILKIIK